VVSMVKNGVYHENSFNEIMATTRNRNLDALARGACLGTTDEMREARLRFGILNGGDEVRDDSQQRGVEIEIKHTSFG